MIGRNIWIMYRIARCRATTVPGH
eukprot:SAG31_NODE_34288_length_334_cov_1.510638_2_plen_23_part_01